MQQYKVIKNIDEVGVYSQDSNILLKTFENIIGQFKLTKVNKMLNRAKTKGVEGENVFKILFVLGFIDLKNISQLMLSGYNTNLNYGKDVLYEFLKNEMVDWQKILTFFSKQFIKITKSKGDSKDIKSPKCLILDDTLISKTGKTIEQIGKVFDHCTRKYQLGMKALTCGFWDGKSFIPLAFSLHNEPGKNNNRGMKAKELASQFSKERQADSPGFQRIGQLEVDKITMAINLVKKAIKASFEPVYVLADTWFMCDTFISEIQKIKIKYAKKLHVLGLMKTNRSVIVNGKKMMANLVPDHKRKDIKYCKKYKCNYLSSKIEYKGNKVKAFWIRMKGQESWKMLVSTDTDLSFTNAMKYYQIRWSIEVFFKECKQNLNIEKCQSTDFDAHIAWITLSFISYIILSLRKRFDDYETMGEVFRDFKNELLEITLVEKLWQIIAELYQEVFAEFGVDWEVFLDKLTENENSIEKMAQIQFAFLKHPNKIVA
jgi:Transposase DDE domain